MRTDNTQVQAYKFSQTATDTPTITIDNPVEFLKSKYTRGSIFGLDNLQRSGRYKLMGWSYDFRPYLKRFIVKQYGSWQDYYAPNKTALRSSIYGRIEEIVSA
jgi:hypothetical protein